MTTQRLLARVKAAEWVAWDAMDLPDAYVVSLTKDPNREDWFRRVLPDLDYEMQGGTWDEPLWAWTKHPWFEALGLTSEECESHLNGSKSGV